MPANHARNVALTPELNAFVDDLVRSGDYANASEVMRAGLRALKDRQSMEEISDRLRRALDELDRGEGVSGEPEVMLGKALDAARRQRAS